MDANAINFVAIIAGLFTIISFCINIIQWVSKNNLVTTLKSRSQATYNYFHQIAQHSDTIRVLHNDRAELSQAVSTAREQAHSINGLCDAARQDIVSYSREHLNFVPRNEHPAQPNPEKLPKPSKR